MRKVLHKETGFIVCDNGDVYGVQGLRKKTLGSQGYIQYGYRKNGKCKSILGHQLVAECFLGDRKGMDVCHKNHIRIDNRVENLVIGTRKENMEMSSDDDRLHTVSQGQRRKIATMYATGCYKREELRNIFGITVHVMKGIIREFEAYKRKRP